LSGWIDGIDPRRSELLGMASATRDGVLKAIFDESWYSLRAPDANANINYDKKFANSVEPLPEIENTNAVYSLNGTHFDRNEYVIRGLNDWMRLMSFDPDPLILETDMCKLSFGPQGQINIWYVGSTYTFPTEYAEDELLDIVFGLQGSLGGSKVRLFLSVNSTYVEDYALENANGAGGPAFDPNNVAKLD
jgi:hypothetical protein